MSDTQSNWTFDPIKEYKGHRYMTAFREELPHCIYGLTPRTDRGKGNYTAYVECTPDEAWKIQHSKYANGGINYFRVYMIVPIGKAYWHKFPDGTPSDEDKVVIGWDYNHSWDYHQFQDIDRIESDIRNLIDEMLTESEE